MILSGSKQTFHPPTNTHSACTGREEEKKGEEKNHYNKYSNQTKEQIKYIPTNLTEISPLKKIKL